jgi:hypothetical protein
VPQRPPSHPWRARRQREDRKEGHSGAGVGISPPWLRPRAPPRIASAVPATARTSPRHEASRARSGSPCRGPRGRAPEPCAPLSPRRIEICERTADR